MSNVIFMDYKVAQLERGEKILYTAVLLNGGNEEKSPVRDRKGGKEFLLEKYPAKHNTVFAHHMTIEFKPSLVETSNFGKVVSLKVIGYAEDEKAQAVLVEPMNKNLGVKNSHPHVTISTDGTPPAYSKELLAKGYSVIEKPFYIKGIVVGVTNKGNYIFDDLDKKEEIEDVLVEENKPIIYCDMDGVLTNFDKSFIEFFEGDFKETNLYADNQETFDKLTGYKTASDILGNIGKLRYKVTSEIPTETWATMEWMPDGKQLWNFIKDYEVIILSTPANSSDSKEGKRKWLRSHVGQVPTILSDQKEKFVKSTKEQKFIPNIKILIDDTKKNIDKWKAAGGVGILHKSTAQTLKQLKELLK